MGMYYELKVDIKLKPIEEIGEEIHALLTCLFNQEQWPGLKDVSESMLPDHPFWRTKRFWQMGYGGYSVDVEEPEDANYTHPVVKLRTYINYGLQEIDSFLDWIAPYTDSVPEPGLYYLEGSREYDLSHYDVKFETNPEGKKAFLMVGHYDRSYGYGPSTEVKSEWVKLPKSET